MRSGTRPRRGWPTRGLLGPDGVATEAGVAMHRDIEHATDVAAARPWAGLGDDEASELADLLLPVARACAQVLPVPNPVGVPAPAAPAQRPAQ